MTTNVNKLVGYLEVIVSEVVQLVLTQQVSDRVRVRDDSALLVIWVSSRLGRRSVTTCIHYRFISDTLPLDIRHSTFDIRHLILSILALAWQLQPSIR